MNDKPNIERIELRAREAREAVARRDAAQSALNAAHQEMNEARAAVISAFDAFDRASAEEFGIFEKVCGEDLARG